MRRPKALWIEDSARLELANLCGPVLFKGTCDLSLADDVTTALSLLRADCFDAVIVDIRLPPGGDPSWREHYRRTGSDKVNAQLGLKLLYWLLRRDTSIHPADPPGWVTPERIGVFTVETRREIERYLGDLGIRVFREKHANLPDTILDELIAEVLAQSSAAAAPGGA